VYHLAQGLGSHDGGFKWDRKADGDSVRISYADGSVYIGAYAKGAREGNGVFHFAMGDVFKGRWVANVREGAGVLTYLHGGHAEGAALILVYKGCTSIAVHIAIAFGAVKWRWPVEPFGAFAFALHLWAGSWSADLRHGDFVEVGADGSKRRSWRKPPCAQRLCMGFVCQ
jgi:hypothetical protein